MRGFRFSGRMSSLGARLSCSPVHRPGYVIDGRGFSASDAARSEWQGAGKGGVENMRISINIEDADVKHEVEQQVRKVIAEIGTEAIKQVVSEVMLVKLDRYDDDRVAATIAKAAENVVAQRLGADWHRDRVIDNAIRDASVSFVANRMKSRGVD